MGNYILVLPVNRKDSLVRPTREITVDIYALLFLLSTVDHKGVYQYGINYSKEDYDEDYAMSYVMIPSQDPVWRSILWTSEFILRRRT